MAPRGFDRYMVALGMGTHPKFARLTHAEFRAHIVGVLAIAAMSPVRGMLLIGDLPAEAVHIARAAGVSERTARSAMYKLIEVGVLIDDEEHDCLRVHNWDDMNPSPKTDRNNAERQRRFRARNARVTTAVTARNGREVEEEVEGEEE